MQKSRGGRGRWVLIIGWKKILENKQFCNSLHSRTAFNHVLKWKLHLRQTQGYFMDDFFFTVYFTPHADWQPLMEPLHNKPYGNFIMFVDSMYFWAHARVDFAPISSCHVVWAPSVTCERDKSASPGAICMISWFAERGRAPAPESRFSQKRLRLLRTTSFRCRVHHVDEKYGTIMSSVIIF